jgi:hypothetical protein
MTTPDSGALRLARASGFGLCAFALSLAAHVAGGGQLPSTVASIVLLAFCCWVSVSLTWRRLGASTALVSLGSLQAILHVALMAASPAGSSCASLMPPSTHDMVGAAMGPTCEAPLAVSTPAPAAAGLSMTVAHVGAAVVLALLLARADQAVWFLATLRWWSVPSGLSGCRPVTRATLVPTVHWVVRLCADLSAASRRGPPACAAPAVA